MCEKAKFYARIYSLTALFSMIADLQNGIEDAKKRKNPPKGKSWTPYEFYIYQKAIDEEIRLNKEEQLILKEAVNIKTSEPVFNLDKAVYLKIRGNCPRAIDIFYQMYDPIKLYKDMTKNSDVGKYATQIIKLYSRPHENTELGVEK